MAFAIEQNVREMCGIPHDALPATEARKRHTANRRRKVGLLTLTVGDGGGRKFRQVFDASEAQRRLNSLLTGWIRGLVVRSVVVRERCKNGAIHFHLIVEMRCDLQTAGGRWTPELRSIHRQLRKRLSGFGFGRAELTPLKKTGAHLAAYVAKYVSKNFAQRRDEDVGKRLVSYVGWDKRQMKPNEFGWVTKGAMEWRSSMVVLSRLAGFSMFHEHARVELAECYGSRWAWRMTGVMSDVAQGMEYRASRRADDKRQDVLDVRECMVRAELNPQWRIWRDRDLWEDYCAQIDAERPPEPEPEPVYEQIDLISRADWRRAA